MKMKREAVVAAVVALALTVVLIGAVGAKVEGSSVAAETGITNLRMSDSCEGVDMLLFPDGTETVYVVFDYSDMHGEERRIKVADGVTLYDETKSYTESGTECIEITHTSGSIPPDTYQTQIYAGGLLPIKTLLWHVRQGEGGEITNLRMSLSPDGPPKEEFVQGVQTIWAVFDYANMEGNEVGVDAYQGDYRFDESPRVSLTGSGTEAISITHYLAAGFPADQYRVHVMKDGYVEGLANWKVLYGVYLPLTLKNQP
jgi:hypothetical protein